MDNCYTPSLLPLKEAVQKQLDLLTPSGATESIPLKHSLNRVLAEDCIADSPIPAHDNSAMDGYALIAGSSSTASYQVIGEALAGHPFAGKVGEGEAVRIMTGATIPYGATAVIMQEQVEREQDDIKLMKEVGAGNSIRRAGEDIAVGTTVIEAGTRLNAGHLALMASLGQAQVKVTTKLKVGVLSTGDELVPLGQPKDHGQLYESNRYFLIGLLQHLNVDYIDYGILPDIPEVIEETFVKAANECDWLISSGGVSVGDADFVKLVLDKIGNIDFWKVAIKPGKPYAFGKIKDCFFSGLPGNPVSSYVTFLQLVQPCLKFISGEKTIYAKEFTATLENEARHSPGREDFQRGFFRQDDTGQLTVHAFGKQGSGIMSSITKANCFVIIPAESDNLPAGSKVTIQPFQDSLR